MVMALVGVGGNLQTESAVKRGKVGQPVRLEKRIGLDVAVFNLIQWAATAGRVTEGSEVRCQKDIEAFRFELGLEGGGRFRKRRCGGSQGADGRLQQSWAV